MKYLFLILIAAVIITSAVSYSTVKTDDAYIYYSYVKNITDGNGWVFNHGERINACTSALYPITLSIIHQITPWIPIPEMAHVFCFFCLFVACAFLFFIFSGSMRYTVPLLFAANPLLHNGIGMETFLMMACMTGTLYLYGKKKQKLTALLSALTILARPDMIIFVGLLYGYDIFTKKNFPKISSMLLLVFPVVAWLMFSWLYFGNPIPSTLAAKIGQARVPGYGHFIDGFNNIPYYITPFFMQLFWLITVSFAVIIIIFRKKIQFRFPVIMIVVWSMVHTLIYALGLRTIDFPWYYSYLALPMAMIVGTGIDFVFIMMKKVKVYGMAVNALITVAIIFATFCIPIEAGKNIRTSDQYWKYQMYKNAAEYINKIPNRKWSFMGTSGIHKKRIGCCEIGVLRYFLVEAKVVDGIGLTFIDQIKSIKHNDYTCWLNGEYIDVDYALVNYPAKSPLEIININYFNYLGKIISKNYSNKALRDHRSIALFERK